jgi:hypothetical protein
VINTYKCNFCFNAKEQYFQSSAPDFRLNFFRIVLETSFYELKQLRFLDNRIITVLVGYESTPFVEICLFPLEDLLN